ncbi:MAG TPA: MopE-related protein, partial [Kofleriaceae bacterium]|nr:MopE-related protein [Kofleriaceae bacterium]
MSTLRLVYPAFGLCLLACGPSQGHLADAGGDDDQTPDARPLECTVGEMRACYTGGSGTEGVGICHGGMQECGDPGYWGPCNGEQRPIAEICPNGIDENCNGTPDDDTDNDGDGYTTCNGDCCDVQGSGCGTPELVNPGAFEAPGNTVDDDCDGMVDNTAAADCDTGLSSNSSTAMDYAKAMDLCQTTTDGDPRWGVISATLSLTSGSGSPAANGRSIRPDFGGATVQHGSSMAVFSSGIAADGDDASPAQNANLFQNGNDLMTTAAVPADFLAAHGGTLPNSPGCPDPADEVGNDGIMLTLTIRAPTNARSFSLSTNFFSAEYPEWVCSPFNDFFVVLLDSTYAGDPANPSDKNLATYTAPDSQVYPIGVNLAFGNTGLFRQCKNGPTGCANALAIDGTTTSCTATTELVGTGYDDLKPSPLPGGAKGYCGTSD